MVEHKPKGHRSQINTDLTHYRTAYPLFFHFFLIFPSPAQLLIENEQFQVAKKLSRA
jgi:hypothetical protein